MAVPFLLLFVPATISGTPQQVPVSTLEPNQFVVRQLNGGATDTFQVALSAGQYLGVIVEQRGIDLELKLARPDGQTLIATDALNITQGPEVAALLATQAGAASHRNCFALEHYNQALAVWQPIGNRFQEAETRMRIGRTYYRLSEWQKSLEYAAQARALYRTLDNKRGEATVLNNTGLVYEKPSEAGKALDHYQQALPLLHTAGAARVVVSLWSVNDKAITELMARFYRKLLQDGQRPAAALRAAQVEMWQQKQGQAPFYWAAFVLQGEWK